MKVIRTTIVTPSQGHESQVADLLKELGDYLSTQPGFIEGYEVRDEERLGRISVWASKEQADHAATQVRTIAIRARVHALTQHQRQERLMEVSAEHHALPIG